MFGSVDFLRNSALHVIPTQLKFKPEGSDFMWITVGWSHTMQQKYIHKKGFCFASIFNPICGQQ
jgi:hypothetical protein